MANEQEHGIIRDLIMTVNNNTASLSEPVTIYRGDRGIELHIKIQQFKFRFGRKTLESMVDDTIVAARAIITGPHHVAHNGEKVGSLTNPNDDRLDSDQPDVDPNLPIEEQVKGTCFQVSAKNIQNNTIIIDIDEKWMDEIQEVGTHSIQIQLYGRAMRGTGGVSTYERLTLPPVTFDVAELLCDYDETDLTIEDMDESIQSKPYGFDIFTKTYIPYGDFRPGNIVPFDALDAMEKALVYTTTEFKEDVNEKFEEQERKHKQLEDRHDEELSALEDKHDLDIIKLENKHKEDITELQTKYAGDILGLQTKHAEDILDLQDKFDLLQQKNTENTDSLDQLYEKLYSDNSDDFGDIYEIKARLDINETETDVFRELWAKEIADYNRRLEEHTEVVNDLYKDLYRPDNGDIHFLKRSVSENENAIIALRNKTETDIKKAEDRSVQTSKDYTDAQIALEEAARISGDNNLKTSIDNEIVRSQNVERELRTDLNTTIASLQSERESRISEDTALGIRIDSAEVTISNESKARISADSALQASIDTEVTNRTNSDIAIYQAIEASNTNISANTAAIAKEISDREGAINALDEKHTGLNNALRLEIDGNIKTAIDELETTIDNDIKTKLEELDEEIDTEIKTSIDALSNSVYTKEEVDSTITWLQENIRGPQGTSILRYMGELNSKEDLINVPQIEGDTYFIGTKVYVCNGPDGPEPIWSEVDLRGPQGFWYTPQIEESLDEDGYTQTFLSWTNNAPEGSLENPATFNIKGQPIKYVVSEEEPNDRNNLWVVDSEQEEYATRDYVDKRNFLKCNSCDRIEFVLQYPDELEPDVLYILVEEDI